jgi:putative DNA primase/helicase
MKAIRKPLKLAAGEASGNGAERCLQDTASDTTRQPTTPFSESMAAHGLHCSDNLVPDGKIHRFHVNGDKPGSKNGFYILYGDGLPAGSYGSWKLNQTFTWCGKSEKSLTENERVKWQEQIAKAKAARDQELKRIHLEAQKRAKAEWENAKPVKEHPYLKAKDVKSYSLREDNKGRLVIPIRDIEGTLHSLQTIDGQGNKLFLPGGAIAGHFSSIDCTGNTLLICEGYSTGATLHEATGRPVACALNCGNLKPVCEALRKKSPDIKIIVCGDDDYQTDGNPGLAKAKEAVEAVGAVLADRCKEKPYFRKSQMG